MLTDIEAETRKDTQGLDQINFFAHYTAAASQASLKKGKDPLEAMKSQDGRQHDERDSGNFLKWKESSKDPLELGKPSTMGLIRVIASHFDVSMLLLPLAFMYEGTARSVWFMSCFAALSVLASRFLLHTVRLQPNNFALKSSFEFEQLISPSFEASVQSKLLSDLYILLQQVQLVLVITASAVLFDQVLVSNYADHVALKPASSFYYIYGLLPAVDET